MPTGFMCPESGNKNRYARLTVNFSTSDGVTILGGMPGLGGTWQEPVTTITEIDTGKVYATFPLDFKKPIVIDFPENFRYRVTPPSGLGLSGYIIPEPVEGVAKAKEKITINFVYDRILRYGYRRAKKTADPAARIEYLYDAEGKTPVDMHLTEDGCTPDLGDWGEFVNEVACPVMLRYDGTEAYELDRDDQTRRADGSPSDISDTAYEGNAMVRFGGKWRWVYRYEDSTHEYVIFANCRYDDNYHAYANTDADGNVQDYFYYGMYEGSYDDTRMRSLAGQPVMVSTTRNQEVTRAKANGTGWYTIYKSAWEYIGDLLTLISKSDDSQGVFGAGYTVGNTEVLTTGSTLGGPTMRSAAFWGSTSGKQGVRVFWIENFWGNIWEGMAGLILKSGTIYTKMVPPYNFDASGYTNTKKTLSTKAGGWINTASVTDAYGFVPTGTAGAEGTYYCDGIWVNASQTDYGCVSAHLTAGAKAGARLVELDRATSRNMEFLGSRLSYIPTDES